MPSPKHYVVRRMIRRAADVERLPGQRHRDVLAGVAQSLPLFLVAMTRVRLARRTKVVGSADYASMSQGMNGTSGETSAYSFSASILSPSNVKTPTERTLMT